MPMGNEPEVDPDIKLTRMAREIRREYWRRQYDMGYHGHADPRSRKQWVDDKLREEGLL